MPQHYTITYTLIIYTYICMYTYRSAILFKVFNDDVRSFSESPNSRPLSATPISYIASPRPSLNLHFICVTKCSNLDDDGFNNFNYVYRHKLWLNKIILISKYITLYSIFPCSSYNNSIIVNIVITLPYILIWLT